MKPLIFPIHGEALAARQRWNNKPELVIVCIAGDCFANAESWNKHSNFSALVLGHEQIEPEKLTWTVNNCICLIEWDVGPTAEFIMQVVKCLLRPGAKSASVMPMFVDHNQPIQYFDRDKQQWVVNRESFKTYYPKKGLAHVA